MLMPRIEKMSRKQWLGRWGLSVTITFLVSLIILVFVSWLFAKEGQSWVVFKDSSPGILLATVVMSPQMMLLLYERNGLLRKSSHS